MWYCKCHGIEFDMEEDGCCPSCSEEWTGPSERAELDKEDEAYAEVGK